ncbi:uncharacterized protein LOC133037832 [Cannabis sativa]|uniref:Protein kinase domain-containing protein n=1 Tax=Cannabis sativa TaxID=3483 RepID=A0A7J6HZL7_CANSA|nr:uncharacterized protein LOC133037832 [Cannabis sativa]XP_060971458.1 uncharacterized protein LOC133037832 [Cannabis sativa]KAF4400734.1 hypothetical protein G4B88_001289 [Cannabis sativa]
MGDNKGETTKKPQSSSKQQPQPQSQQQQISSSSPKDAILDESNETRPHHHHHPPHQQTSTVVVSGASHIISSPLYIPSGATSSSPFDQQQFDQAVNNPKRPRYTTTGQWKILPSPSSQQKQQQVAQMTILTGESSPISAPQQQPPTQVVLHSTGAASSSDTASSPSHSIPSLSGSGQDTSKPELAGENPVHQQFRKGKYVSPVWKPNEMLWLARAWRVQYQGGGSSSRMESVSGADINLVGSQTKGKTRADKDKEVAEFLQRHGVNRDAKTAGTKWDNMLGEFRKVYEWERGGEREHVGKSYFRLSPYERKLHRLPASFDEEVFEELSQFMGSKMRTPLSTRPGSSLIVAGESRALTAPPPFKEDDQFPLSAVRTTKQLIMGSGVETLYYGGRGGLMGFESSVDMGGPSPPSTSSKDLRRIGKIRMSWEESVSLWAEEGELHRGRVKLQTSSFLNADELTYLDDAMVATTMEAFEEGPLRGFSVDRFVSGQQVKVFGRKKPFSVSASGFAEKVHQLPFTEPSVRSIPPWDFQDPSDYYVGCLRVSPPSIPTLFELSWYLQEAPPEELRLPLRKDVYRDLPQGKEHFFTISNELVDCRAFTYDILSPIIRTTPSLTSSTSTSRDSFIGLWDDCINRIVSKFCSVDIVTVRKPTNPNSTEVLQDQWPNMTGFVRNFCLWRGEETDQVREGQIDPSNSLVEKLFWTYQDLPYILGYYAVGFLVTFCALSRGANQDRIIRTDLQSLDLSSPSDRLKALIPCYRIASLLPLLADRCFHSVNNMINVVASSKMIPYSDFERLDTGNGNVTEITPNTVTRFYPNKRKWAAVKEIYDFLDHRIPHAEFIHRSSEKNLGLVFKPRGFSKPARPINYDQLIESLKCVTKALVALHDLSFMHRDLSWDKVVRRVDRDNEWFVSGFEDAVVAPQIYPMVKLAGGGDQAAARGRHAPEMERGLHGVKVDVWGVGYLVRTCGVGNVPKMLRELQNRCLDQNPEQRPTAADCYHHLLQLQSSMQSATATGVLM